MHFLKVLLIGLGLTFMFPSFAELSPKELLKDYEMPVGYSEPKQLIAHALIEEGVGVLIDCRTREEYEKGHIEGAINLDSEVITADMLKQYAPDESTPILIYCRSGRRAGIVGKDLVKSGYKHVLNFGGINTWPYGLIQD